MRVETKPSQSKPLLDVFKDPAMMVWCLYQILTPFYVIKSGLPQPGDWLVLLLFPLALSRWNGRFDRPTIQTLRPLLWFTMWVAVVNYGWSLVMWRWGNPKDFILHPFFYAFNFAILFSALVFAKRDPRWFLRVTVDVNFAMVMFQVVASFFYRTQDFRGQLFFNSPNQLGYYALLAACLFAMTQRQLGIGRLRASLGIVGCAYLAVLSSSRASLIGIALLFVILVFSSPRTIILGGLVALGLTSLGGPIKDAIDTAEYRALKQRHDATFAEERGNDRLWDYPEHLLIGAGEGAYERFANPGQVARELHSSFGSIVFSYGIVGVALFLMFGWHLIRGTPPRTTIILVPALAYTVAHQGLRFTMFWVVIAAFMVLKMLPDEQQQSPSRAGTTGRGQS